MPSPPPLPAPAAWPGLLVVAAFGLALQGAAYLLGGYGYFIDEFYYLSCARRLAFGYVDHPPLAPLLLRGVTLLFGESLFALRLLPALAGAALVLLTGWVAARLGGGRTAQLVAGLATLAPPYLLLVFGFYSMNCLEPLVWTGLVAVVVEMVRRGDPRLWLTFGVLGGLGFEAKHTVVTVAGALVVGLALTPARRLLASPWLAAGALAGLAIAAPNLLWQAAHGWPSLEFYRNATLHKNVPTAPLAVMAHQVLFMNPATAPLWLAGLAFLMAGRGRSWRSVGWAYLLLLALLIAARSSRPDRLGAFYPALLAAGGVVLEQGARRVRALLPAALCLLGAGFLALAPIGLPLLPPPVLARYVAALGVIPPIERGEGKRAELPQWFADRFGWEQLVREVAAIHGSLPPEERDRVVVVAPSYGQAGAVEVLWPGGHPPPVVSAHNNWFFWSRDVLARRPIDVAIGIGQRDALSLSYAEVTQVGLHDCDYCIAWRDRMPLYVARRPRFSPEELRARWEAARHFE